MLGATLVQPLCLYISLNYDNENGSGRHKPAIASSKKNMWAEEVQALMASTDTDGVGLLDEEEFLRLVRG